MVQSLDMTFKQYQQKCQREIQQEQKQYEQSITAEMQQQQIRVNDLWAESNMKLLQRCVAYARHNQPHDFAPLFAVFCQEEMNRKMDRYALKQMWHLETLADVHKEQRSTLLQEISGIIQGYVSGEVK